MKTFIRFSFIKYLILFFLGKLTLILGQQDCEAFGVHLSLGDYFQRFINKNDANLLDDSSSNVLLRINYMTNSECATSYASLNGIKVSPLTPVLFNGSTLNPSSNFLVYLQTIQIETNLSLPLSTVIYYTIYANNSGTDPGKTFLFNIPNRDSDSHTLIIVGDMDTSSTDSSLTISALQVLANQPKQISVSAVLYTGNMAYNLETNDFSNGVNFLKKIQVFAGFWPLMPTPGIVDNYANYSLYQSLFKTVNNKLFQNNFGSFNLGKAHIVQINMAYFFDNSTTSDQRQVLLNWLNEDLVNANISANKEERPWIIVYGYHSFYCSIQNDIFCGTHVNSSYPNYLALFNSFEQIFMNFAVDLYISSATQSIYERLPPIQFQTKKSYSSLISPDVNQLYMVNPGGTVYIIEGVGGNQNTSDNQFDQKLGFTLVQGKTPGYGKLTILNGTYLLYQHVSASSSADSDMFYLINTKQKWTPIWEPADKRTFTIAFVFFVVIGSLILVVFMLSLE